MNARTVVQGGVAAVAVAYWGLALLGAVGNGNWSLVVVLCLPLAYLAGAGIRRARTQPATVPAETSEGR